MEPRKYSVGERVILLEARPEDGNSVCIVKKAFYDTHRDGWFYDLEIIASTHYGPEAVGELYGPATPEWRLGPVPACLDEPG